MASFLRGRALVAGTARGEVAHADVGLSFWGGVDPASGRVIDRHHPLCGRSLSGKILAIPSGRGSCTGSSVLLQVIHSGCAPAGILLSEPDEIIALGVIVAEELFGRSLPVVSLGAQQFSELASARYAQVQHGGVRLGASLAELEGGPPPLPQAEAEAEAEAEATAGPDLELSAQDRDMLDGREGRAAQAAMRIVVRMARVQCATELIDVTQAHIDGCVYTGPASLHFAQKLVEWGGQVRVPTTLNAISVDHRRWRQLGVPEEFGGPASALGDAYLALGAKPSFTCAPYLLESAPAFGEQISWGESNAVIFANSVLGARTQKYADYLDACMAITGRAPRAGPHLAEERKAKLVLEVPPLPHLDDSFYNVLGYAAGLLAGKRIPAITGLEDAAPSRDDLKALSAAFGTTSGAPMFHVVGVTPEAPDLASALGLPGTAGPGQDVPSDVELRRLGPEDLEAAWAELGGAEGGESAAREEGRREEKVRVDLVSLGNPHFSAEEMARLAALCQGRRSHDGVSVVLTVGRAVQEQARRAGHLQALRDFGVILVNDTCWCMLGEPVVPRGARALLTNSAKYAHYAPGLVGRRALFAGLGGCVEAACSGAAPAERPAWLRAAAAQRRHFSAAAAMRPRLAHHLFRAVRRCLH